MRQLMTRDRQLRFDFRRIHSGVLVTRLHTLATEEVEHMLLLTDPSLFGQYLERDSLRFTYPAFYLELSKVFDELFALNP